MATDEHLTSAAGEEPAVAVDETSEAAGTAVAPAEAPVPARPPSRTVAPARPDTTPQDCSCGGTNGECTCNKSGSLGWVYAIGKLRPTFPDESVEREFRTALGQKKPPRPIPDDAALYDVLSQGRELYLAREMCWILQIDGVDAYIVQPRTSVELYELILDLWPRPGDRRFDVVVGPRGPIAPPDLCNGVQLPTAIANEIYTFTFNEFVAAVVADTGVAHPFAASMFDRMLQLSDNAGGTDEHRAINYITMRYMTIYQMSREMLDPTLPPRGVYTLVAVTAMPAKVQGSRRVVDVVFRYQERETGEGVNWFCRVDVTGQFPFLVTNLTRYYPGP